MELRPTPFDQFADGVTFVSGQIVDQHQVARLQRRHQHLFDIGLKGISTRRPFEDPRCDNALEPKAATTV